MTPVRNRTLFGVPFSPPQIAGLQVWYDGADPSTVTIATGVSEWRDKSGFARNAVQANTSRQLPFVANARFGRSAIAFNNAGWLTSTHTYTLGTILVVYEQPTSADSNDGIVSMRTASSNKLSDSSLAYNINLPFEPNIALDPSPAGGSHRLNRVTTEAAFLQFFSGVPARTTPDRWNLVTSTFPPNAGAKNMVIGADVFTADARAANNGHIAEIIGYDRQLQSAEIQRLEDYLRSKWGTP